MNGYIKNLLECEISKARPCACGKMKVASTRPVGDMEAWTKDAIFLKDCSFVFARQLTKCNVCGHVAALHAKVAASSELIDS